ncbi:hypothetical protein IWW34DRAFT_675164 [Fusarium oxysporum f. sp. albedinis]|nr:hypothetical protein IWW34DRAFT_675164 [Fusarium oxysporum f. sp. albedinis]
MSSIHPMLVWASASMVTHAKLARDRRCIKSSLRIKTESKLCAVIMLSTLLQ